MKKINVQKTPKLGAKPGGVEEGKENNQTRLKSKQMGNREGGGGGKEERRGGRKKNGRRRRKKTPKPKETTTKPNTQNQNTQQPREKPTEQAENTPSNTTPTCTAVRDSTHPKRSTQAPPGEYHPPTTHTRQGSKG